MTIEDTHFEFSTTPGVVIKKLKIKDDIEFDQVALRFTWRHVAQAFQNSRISWAEVVVGPSKMSILQGHDLMQLMARLDRALPADIAAVHFTDLQFPDQPWLKGNWKLDLTRDRNGSFRSATAAQTAGRGSVEVELTPESPEVVDFNFKSFQWPLPFAIRTPIESVEAEGKISYAELEVSNYSLSGPFGEIHGKVSGTADGGWKLGGILATDGVDVDSFLRVIAPPEKKEDASGAEIPSLIQGLASAVGQLSGKGADLQEAAENTVLTAKFDVRNAVLNGINLGFIATNPDANPEAGGGTTRFTKMDGALVVGGGKTTLREFHARAGALVASGQVEIADNNRIEGLLHVDLGSTRVLAPIRVRLHGTLNEAKFGR